MARILANVLYSLLLHVFWIEFLAGKCVYNGLKIRCLKNFRGFIINQYENYMNKDIEIYMKLHICSDNQFINMQVATRLEIMRTEEVRNGNVLNVAQIGHMTVLLNPVGNNGTSRLRLKFTPNGPHPKTVQFFDKTISDTKCSANVYWFKSGSNSVLFTFLCTFLVLVIITTCWFLVKRQRRRRHCEQHNHQMNDLPFR